MAKASVHLVGTYRRREHQLDSFDGIDDGHIFGLTVSPIRLAVKHNAVISHGEIATTHAVEKLDLCIVSG